MIHIVAKVFNLFTLTLQNVIVVASLIGQVIVALSSAVITSVLSVFRSLLYFLQVVYEDNLFIFTEELPNFANNVISGCVDQWVWVGDTLGALCDTVYSRASDAVGAVCWLVSASSTVVAEVLYLIRNFVIFFGDTLWLIITFIPCQLPLLIRAFGRYVKEIMFKTIVDVYMSLLKLTNFLSDVPIESFVGIMSAVVIVRLCIHFREDIQSYGNDLYWLLIRRLLYWYHTLYNYFTDSEVRQIANMASGPEVEGPELSGRILEDDPADPAEALCVICQERQKCVLILPCRHVCLCRECCLRLYGYQRTCPICRTFIYHSVNIYL